MNALTRTPALIAALVVALLSFPVVALGDGADVIADYDANGGQIVGCYTLSEYAEALAIVGPDPQYGELADTINDARLSNVVEVEGAECGEGVTPVANTSEDAEESGGGGNILLIVGAIVVIAGLGGGVLAWLRRSRGPAQ